MSNASRAADRSDDAAIVILSNRGPHDFIRQDGHWLAKIASDGLPPMISPLARQPNVVWFCCVSEPPGCESQRDSLFTTAKDQTDPDLNVVPVPLPAAIYQDYYAEISNKLLWPLHHQLLARFSKAPIDSTRHLAWNHYIEANLRMAEAVVATQIPVRSFIIQDYHLFPLPAMLRRRFPHVPCLHFTHIPFPDPSLLKLLPKTWREQLLYGMLGADSLGFQSPTDVLSFLSCCKQFLPLSVDFSQRSILLPCGRCVHVRSFPTSIDPDSLQPASPELALARQRLLLESPSKNIVRIDRLDPSKNHVLGFRAFDRLLELQPEARGQLRFLAFFIPSRTDQTIYLDYHDSVLREVSRVNQRWNKACGFDPIRVFYTHDRALALAALELCDIFLVNSHQDRSQLFLREWAMVSSRPGVLLISETAELDSALVQNAIPISPLDLEGTALAMIDALATPVPQRLRWLEQLRLHIRNWTSKHWLNAQLLELGIPLPPPPAPLASPKTGEPLECQLTILNAEGIHARPAAAFVRCVRQFQSQIDILKNDSLFPARSILSVLTANLNCGTVFTLRLTGPDAPEALQAVRDLLLRLKAEDPPP